MPSNETDAALIRRETGASHEIVGLGFVAGPPETAYEGMPVKKSGGSTGVTHGHVVANPVTRTLGYRWDPATRRYRFLGEFGGQFLVRGNGWLSRRFAAEGDSGSILLTEADNRPVGLLIGATPNGWGIVTPIGVILRAFQARILYRMRPMGHS